MSPGGDDLWPYSRRKRHDRKGEGAYEMAGAVRRRRVRRLLGAALLVLGRDPGVTLVSVDRWTLAEDLWSFGEDSLSQAALEISDEEMVNLWVHAGKALLKGDARSSGEAAALAAVAVIEGHERPLARKRRRPRAGRLRFEQTPEERYADIERIEESESFPERWR
jgi:hypothetical protein